MGSVGRAEPLVCDYCWLRSIIIDETFVCEVCVCVLLLVFKSNVLLSSFLQHALLVHRIAKQHCELSFGAGGNERVLG